MWMWIKERKQVLCYVLLVAWLAWSPSVIGFVVLIVIGGGMAWFNDWVTVISDATQRDQEDMVALYKKVIARNQWLVEENERLKGYSSHLGRN